MNVRTVVLPLALLLAWSPVLAIERSTAGEAVALIDRAVDYMKKNGAEKAIAEFNNLASPFNVASDINKKGDLYLFMFVSRPPAMIQLVHGKNPKIVNQDVSEMRDVDGVYLIREIMKTCASKAGKGWVNYKWPNPLNNQVESKQSYVVKVDEYCIGTGIYK